MMKGIEQCLTKIRGLLKICILPLSAGMTRNSYFSSPFNAKLFTEKKVNVQLMDIRDNKVKRNKEED